MPAVKLANHLFGKNATVNYCIIVSSTPGVWLSDVKAIEELYTKYNHCFTKHPYIQQITECLLGRSILFNESNAEMKARRAALTPAFYKGKLQGIIDIAKAQVAKTMMRFDELTKATGTA